METTMIKLTFTGDIMCEKYILKKRSPDQTNFNSIFAPCKEIFRESDLVIGNLETVFAGAEAGYSKEMFSFNTPDSFLDTLTQIPVHFVTTANNHALDRKKQGLIRTIEQLDKRGILHTGTSIDPDTAKLYKIIECQGLRLAIISLTASTNYHEHKYQLKPEDEKMINLLMPQNYYGEEKTPKTVKDIIFRIAFNLLGQERFMKIRKWYGGTTVLAYDDPLYPEQMQKIEHYAAAIKKEMDDAKSKSEFLIICPHMGGQFNVVPGTFSEWYMNFFRENGADLIIGNHPHIIQKADLSENCPIFYSLGNLSMYPDSTFILKENKPEIGLVVHVYLNTKTKEINDISCVPVKMSLTENKQMQVSPLLAELSESELNIWIDWLSKRLQQKLILKNNELFCSIQEA